MVSVSGIRHGTVVTMYRTEENEINEGGRLAAQAGPQSPIEQELLMDTRHSNPDDEIGADGGLEHLRLATGFAMAERDRIVSQFAPLGARLRSVERDGVDMELSVKERGGADQRMTLELWIAGRERLVATSSQTDVQSALREVRDDMVRQLDDSITRRERSRQRPAR